MFFDDDDDDGGGGGGDGDANNEEEDEDDNDTDANNRDYDDHDGYCADGARRGLTPFWPAKESSSLLAEGTGVHMSQGVPLGFMSKYVCFGGMMRVYVYLVVIHNVRHGSHQLPESATPVPKLDRLGLVAGPTIRRYILSSMQRYSI